VVAEMGEAGPARESEEVAGGAAGCELERMVGCQASRSTMAAMNSQYLRVCIAQPPPLTRYLTQPARATLLLPTVRVTQLSALLPALSVRPSTDTALARWRADTMSRCPPKGPLS
jgi:hypothetical protein